MAPRGSPAPSPITGRDEAPPRSWLARPVVSTPPRGRPWRPVTIDGVSLRGLRYVVVDEVFSDLAELTLSSWPIRDAQGRLRFADAAIGHVEVDSARMRSFLRRHRMPRKAASRPLRTGDTFAFLVRSRQLARFLEQLTSPSLTEIERGRLREPAHWDWLTPPVYDLTSEAREAAKLSYNAALTHPLPDGAVEGR